MRNIFIIFGLLLLGNYNSFCQKIKAHNQLGLSIPVIWNDSKAKYYSLGKPKYASGSAISYGVNVNYSRSLYRNVYGFLGVGYFRQAFSIVRPFRFNSPIEPLFHTESYCYDNHKLSAGLVIENN